MTLTYSGIYSGIVDDRCLIIQMRWDRRGRDRMVVGFTTTYAISAYHH